MFMPTVFLMLSLLLLAAAPGVIKFWMRSREQHQRDLYEPSAGVAMPWLRIVGRGPVVGKKGEQAIFDWLDVRKRSGEIVRLRYTTKALGDRVQGALVVLHAGSVTYVQEGV